jgi:cobalamin biosynthesis Mg chelatase CobN
MKKIQDVLDEVDLDVSELPEPTQRRIQTYANLEKQLIAAKLELESLDEPDAEKQQTYEDAITYFNDYEADVIESIQSYAVRLNNELQAKAMKERREREQKEKENEKRIQARKEAEQRENEAKEKARKEQEQKVQKAKEDLEKANAKAQEEALKEKEEAEERARLEEEARKPKKKSGGLGWLLAGLGIVAAVVTLGATKDK